MDNDTKHRIYAGALGKIIGVYLGRPVEGWPYQKIIDTFGTVPYYVHEECKMPLVVADDDISGTFGFFRALLDHPGSVIPDDAFGKTWLNYIIENRTILWWGGLGRSTEHTAWLNLRSGIPSPESGSMKRNGQTLTEQIGAQIFVDAIAMACPGDPERATALVEKAARVSHDGLAVQGARHLAALESLAFYCSDLDTLFDEARPYCADKRLLSVIDDVRDACNSLDSWRQVRDHIELHHGYSVYPGPCHMVPNHAAVVACLTLGGDSFQRSIELASSMGWDTDCNAGNVGALNGIRLGLSGIDAGADFRAPVADRLLVVTAAGGATVSDAVLETRNIVEAAEKLDGGENRDQTMARFQWEFPGSTQGWSFCPYSEGMTAHANLNLQGEVGSEPGLSIDCPRIAPGTPLLLSTPTFLDFTDLAGNFSTIASPTLYEGQTVEFSIELNGDGVAAIAPYVLYYDLDNSVKRIIGPSVSVRNSGTLTQSWEVPEVNGMPIFRMGFQLSSPTCYAGSLRLVSVDWHGAPKYFAQQGMMMTSIWETLPHWTQMWCSSAEHFAADFFHTLCISHPEAGGLATIGTDDWDDYRVSSGLEFSLHEAGGLVLRARGHRRYYALVLSGGDTAQIVKQYDEHRTVLSSTEFAYQPDCPYQVSFGAIGDHLFAMIDGQMLMETDDPTYRNGEAGFLISRGSMTADGFVVEATDTRHLLTERKHDESTADYPRL